MYSREELKSWFEENDYPKSRSIAKRKRPEIYQSMIDQTSFLNDTHIVPTMGLRCHCVINDIYSIPLCPTCGAQLKKTGIKDEHGYYGFTSFCSHKCGNETRIKKMQETTLERYGETNAMKNEEVKNKAVATEMKKREEDPRRRERFIEKRQATIKERYGEDGLANESITQKRKNTNMERYGVDNPFQLEDFVEKSQATMKERYGTVNVWDIEGVREKYENTMKERYGETSYFKTDEFLEKSRNTNNERYGVDYYVQSEQFKEKSKRTMKERYGKENYSQIHIDDDILEVLSDESIMGDIYDEAGFVRKMASRLNVDKKTISRRLKSHGIHVNNVISSSIKENDMCAYIESIYDGKILTSDSSVIAPKHLDVHLPEIGVAFEFNGLYWHSSKFKSNDYHQRKSIDCMEKGVQLFHIWEDDWDNNREIVKKLIKRAVGVVDEERIWARKCYFTDEVTYAEVRDILENNHIQGTIKNGIRVGLRDKATEELVACCLFLDKGDGEFELTRYATTKNVVGGLSKILSHFKKIRECKKIVSFARLDVSHGDLYEKTGFTKVHITAPSLWYFDSSASVRLPRHSFMKHKLPSILDDFDEELTEKENMIKHGLVPIYDAGMIKYEMVL